MIRYAILGFGHHAIRRIVPAFPAATASRLVGLWRRDPAKARANADAYGIEHVFPTAEALCSSPEVDAVFVASPDSRHLPDVLLALAHGKPVLCEKPLAMNAAEVEEMLAAARAAGVPFGVAQNMRFNRSVELLRRRVAEGRIGRPLLAHAQFCYSVAGHPRVWLYDPSTALGGPIGDVGVHCIDALRFVLDTEVAGVSTLARRDAGSGEVEAYGVIALEFAAGSMGTVTVTTRGAYRSLVEITGESGILRAEDGLTVDHEVRVELIRHGEATEFETVSNADGYTRMFDSFSAAIIGKSSFPAPGEDGLANQRILDAAYRSWKTGMKEQLLASSH